ncbi:hypothetical protein ACFQ1S_21535, partial [Kibdelosporangium lantanae]
MNRAKRYVFHNGLSIGFGLLLLLALVGQALTGLTGGACGATARASAAVSTAGTIMLARLGKPLVLVDGARPTKVGWSYLHHGHARSAGAVHPALVPDRLVHFGHLAGRAEQQVAVERAATGE